MFEALHGWAGCLLETVELIRILPKDGKEQGLKGLRLSRYERLNRGKVMDKWTKTCADASTVNRVLFAAESTERGKLRAKNFQPLHIIRTRTCTTIRHSWENYVVTETDG